MTPREERGLIIAATCRLNRLPDGTWLVPSQTAKTGGSAYRVNLEAKTCTCLDHTEGGNVCKHFYAASIVCKRDVLPDGTVIEESTITLTKKRVYKQNWPAYNKAQATEKRRFRVLLHDLCSRLPTRQRERKVQGRQHTLPSDAVFAIVFKVYCGLSARRFNTDLEEAADMGFLTKRMNYMGITAFLEDTYFTPILRELIGLSARPLRTVETKFAIDSSGFGTSCFEKWYDQKYGVTRTRGLWVKAHVASGVKTHIVTAVRILDHYSNDCPQFSPLVRETRNNFEIEEVSADGAYASLDNFETVADCGGNLFVQFKSNASGQIGGLFEKAFHFFQFKQEEYLEHYHKRSNVESTFSAVKRKFGSSVMSKKESARTNEVLCKFICHNICCLIQEQETLGIVPVFWKDEPTEQNPEVLPFERPIS